MIELHVVHALQTESFDLFILQGFVESDRLSLTNSHMTDKIQKVALDRLIPNRIFSWLGLDETKSRLDKIPGQTFWSVS